MKKDKSYFDAKLDLTNKFLCNVSWTLSMMI